MTDPTPDPIEGLAPEGLMRQALDGARTRDGASAGPNANERSAREELELRARIEERLPDLELLELLGRGGMGSVFRARQKRLDREVAVKVVVPQEEHRAEFASRFEREAQALARLNHANLVAVHDYGQDDDLGWLIMEYVDGSNLRDLMTSGRLTPGEALALVPKICDALQYAHDHGVVHRDVKPENILLDSRDGVKIADFGLAKLSDGSVPMATLTGTQQVLGTFRYMAPEQLDKPLEVDHRADIYSLGVVLYEMLTGEIPMGRFDPPSERSDADPSVDSVVLRALEKEPGRRYQRAAEVKSDLAAVDAGEHAEPQRAPRAEDGETRVSVLAIVSAVLFGLGLVPPLMVLAFILMSGANPDGPQPSLAITKLGPSLMAAFLWSIACLLGFHALGEIRRQWPHRTGVGAAVVGACAAPFLVGTAVVFAIAERILDSLVNLGSGAAGLGAILYIGTNVALLALVRHVLIRRMNARLASEAA